ncbi:MAG: hypothetical protein HDS79_01455 [Bacteroidales bacterium]|nr:hypothetical protein [Bacteroidales bacterium]
MLHKIFCAGLLLGTALCVNAQENRVNRIPEVTPDSNQTRYEEFDKGFWWSAEALGGYSTRIYGHNMGMAELDVTAGYRFSEYIKVGLGLGARYYINQDHVRRYSSAWGMPIFVAARGNFVPGKYRFVTPYWGMEFGGSVRDGVMLRPTIGLHIGDPRSAFTIGLSYMGQSLATYNFEGHDATHFTSFFCLRLGYEF